MAVAARSVAVVGAWLMAGTVCLAQETGPAGNLAGQWSGEAMFRLTSGDVRQEHTFVFEPSTDRFVAGEHSWTIPDRSLRSNDGGGDTFEAREPFLGVVDGEEIWLVEHGDLTMFRLRLTDPDTIEFLALEGGPNALVGFGTLTRD